MTSGLATFSSQHGRGPIQLHIGCGILIKTTNAGPGIPMVLITLMSFDTDIAALPAKCAEHFNVITHGSVSIIEPLYIYTSRRLF